MPAGWEPDRYAAARRSMVVDQLERRGIRDLTVLAAMAELPRERFVPIEQADRSYEDRALQIGGGQTISQPYIVARMSAALELSAWTADHPGDPPLVLDVGTGSGYQAAVLARLGARVVSVERDERLAVEAAQRLAGLGIGNVSVVIGDGSAGWPDDAPYAGVVVGAAAPDIPPPLEEQLAPGGRLVIPVGRRSRQVMLVVRRLADRFERRDLEPCLFVPLLGRWGFEA